MGFAIRVGAYGAEWETTYFVQGANELRAKKRAFEMFKETVSCVLPDTIEEAEQDDNIYIEVLATIEQIIL